MPLLGCQPHPLGLCWGHPMSQFGDTQVCPLAALEMCWEFPWWKHWKRSVPSTWEGFLVCSCAVGYAGLCCGGSSPWLSWCRAGTEPPSPAVLCSLAGGAVSPHRVVRPFTHRLAGWKAVWSGDRFCHVWWHWEGRNPHLSSLWGPRGNVGGSRAAQVTPACDSHQRSMSANWVMLEVALSAGRRAGKGGAKL